MTKEMIQQRVSMLNEESFKRFSKEQSDFFNNTSYEGLLPEDEIFSHYRQFSFSHRSEAYLNISFDYWYYLAFGKLEEGLKYNFQDIVTYLTASQMINLVDWIRFHGQSQETLSEFKEYRKSICEMENYINPIIETFTNDLIDKLLKIQSSIVKQSAGIPIGNHRSPQIQMSKRK